MGSRVYVGGIAAETRERDLEGFFKGYGRIRDVLIKNGYGFVEFDDYRDAEDAVYDLNGKKLLGARVSVEVARGKPRGRDQEWFASREPRRAARGPPVRTPHRVFVENLSSSVSWQDLKDHLRAAGEVSFADAHKKYRNEGIVEFATHEDMKRAIKKFDDTVLNGRRIRLVEDKSSKRRSYSKSASRSRSRSKSAAARSKSRSRSRERRSRSRSASKASEKRAASGSRSGSAGAVDDAKKPKRSKSRSASPEPEKTERERSYSRGAAHISAPPDRGPGATGRDRGVVKIYKLV